MLYQLSYGHPKESFGAFAVSCAKQLLRYELGVLLGTLPLCLILFRLPETLLGPLLLFMRQR
jgi:hypothetical protein